MTLKDLRWGDLEHIDVEGPRVLGQELFVVGVFVEAGPVAEKDRPSRRSSAKPDGLAAPCVLLQVLVQCRADAYAGRPDGSDHDDDQQSDDDDDGLLEIHFELVWATLLLAWGNYEPVTFSLNELTSFRWLIPSSA